MPRMPLHLATGTGLWRNWTPKVIRFVRYGCTNRPFYHIVVMDRFIDQRKPPIEQLGSYDPSENVHNEKLVAFNFERIQFWLGKGNVTVSRPVEELMGLAGFFPIHPRTYMKAWRNRRAAEEAAAKAEEAEADGEKSAASEAA